MLFYAFLVALALSIVGSIVLKKTLKPVSSKKERFVSESKKAGRNLRQFTWREVRDNVLRRFKYANMSQEFREELNKDIYRLGWEYSAEDIRKMQILYSFLFIVFSIFMFFISSLIGIIMIMFVFFVWNIPVNQIKKEIKERDTEFLSSLHGLYTVIYNQYKRNNSEHLGNILQSYLPTATPLMRKELMLMLRDIESGEDYALKQLRLRIPKPVVLRFCDIILNNLEGVDNRDVMENFYMELKGERDLRRRKRNEQREKSQVRMTQLLYIPFGFLVIVYLIVSTISNF